MEFPTTHPRVRFGLFEADIPRRKLYKRGLPVHLQDQPFQILAMLLDRPGELVTREELRKALWPDGTFVEFDEGLNTAVKKLRYALSDSADNPVFIETIPRQGYRFVVPVTEELSQPVSEANSGAQAKPILPEGNSTVSLTARTPAEIERTVPSRTRVKYLVLISIAAVAILSALGARDWPWHSNGVNPQKMEITHLTDSGNAVHVAISPDGRYVAYATRDREGVRLWLRQVATRSDVQVLPPSPVGFQGLSFSPDGNYIYFVRPVENDPGFKYLYMVPAFGGPARLLIKDIDSSVSFSPDGSQFVFTRGIPTRNFTEVRIANADGTGDHLLANLPDSFAGYQPGATWSPDGNTIAVSVMRLGQKSGFVLDTISVADRRVRELQSSPFEIGRALWLSRGGTLLAPFDDHGEHGQLWAISYPEGNLSRLTNDLSDYLLGRIDITRDAKRIAVIEQNITSNIWAAAATDLSDARQISSNEPPISEVTEMPDGRLLGLSWRGELWIMNADGSDRTLFTNGKNLGPAVACGGFVLFNSYEGQRADLMRVDADGTNLLTLASGNFSPPTCVWSGKEVYYVDVSRPQRIMRMSLNGGSAVEIARIPSDGICGRLTLSPDGKFLAYPYEQFTPDPLIRLAVIPSEGGSAVAVLKAPGGVYGLGRLRWSPDGTALQYLLIRNEVSNLWEQPINGAEAREVTGFQWGRIFGFDWSRDNRRLLLARGDVKSNVVLVSNFH